MDFEVKWFALMVVGCAFAAALAAAVESYSDNQVKIACYETAKAAVQANAGTASIGISCSNLK